MKNVSDGSKNAAPPPGAWGELYQILNNLLQRRQYLAPFVKEFKYIDATLAKYFEGMSVVHIGGYKIEGRYLPPGVKAKYCPRQKEWQITIVEQEGK